jgi:predicted phage terminase large subunit-like protein
MVTAGVGGQLTGRGAHLFIIDDPVKDAEEANSVADQERKWNWWRQVAQTRLEPGGVVVLMMTRWHENDLGGRILEHEKDLWEVITLPALAEDEDILGRRPGAALCPERYDENALGAINTSIGTQAWSALYQQHPTPEGGGSFKRKDFRYWTPYPAEEKTYVLHDDDGSLLVPTSECWRFITADLALTRKTSGDFSVAAIWDVAPWLTPSRLILVGVERERYEGAEHVDWLLRLWRQYSPGYIGVEKAQQGSMTMAFLQRQGVLVRPLEHKSQDKPFRAKDAELLVENHRVYFPRKADWLSTFEHELLMFPHGTHDDQVDVFAYAAKEILRGINMRGRKPKTPEPDSLQDRIWKQLAAKKVAYHPMLGKGY